MWVRTHPFPCCLKHSTRVDSTDKIDFCKELGHVISMGAADTPKVSGGLDHEWDHGCVWEMVFDSAVVIGPAPSFNRMVQRNFSAFHSGYLGWTSRN